MASAKAKAIVTRLGQIKDRASRINREQGLKGRSAVAADLAEEAAGLGLELYDLLTRKKG